MNTEIKYITELHPKGYLPVDAKVINQLKPGQRLKVTIQPLDYDVDYSQSIKESQSKASEFLDFLKNNATGGGYNEQVISRNFIHED
ncbi:MAG: hypothetical protein ABR542_10380 [Desulfonatronovibrio sp.]